MNKYVELYKRHEVLDVLRIRGNIENLDKRELVSLIMDAPPYGYIGTVTFGKFRLGIEHCGDNARNSLASYFKTEEEMVAFIHDNLDVAFLKAIEKFSDYTYRLNICPFEWYPKDYFGSGNKPTGSQASPKILNYHLAPYMPIIQKFMVDALTDNLYIMEGGELVKQ